MIELFKSVKLRMKKIKSLDKLSKHIVDTDIQELLEALTLDKLHACYKSMYEAKRAEKTRISKEDQLLGYLGNHSLKTNQDLK